MKTYLKPLIFLLFLTGIFSSCNNQPKPEQKTAPALEATVPAENGIKVELASLGSTNDLVCGMSIKDGVADTASFNGKLYGFCSKSCKEDFLKEPLKYVGVK